MATFNVTTNADIVGTTISRQVLEYFKENFVIAKLCTRRYESEMPEHGTVQVPDFGDFTAVEKTPGTALTFGGASTSVVSVTLNKHVNVPILLEDTLSVTSKQNIQEVYGSQGGRALKKKVENIIIDEILANAGTTVGSLGSDIDTTVIENIVKTFDTELADEEYPRHVVIGPEGKKDILNITEYRNANTYGNANVMQKGSLSPYLGLNFHQSQLIPASGSGYRGFAMIEPAVAIVSAPLDAIEANGVVSNIYTDDETNLSIRYTMQYDLDNVGWKMNLDLYFGVKVLRSEWVIEVLH